MPPDRSALDVLKRLREENCMAPVLVTSANGSIAMAVDAIKSGAADFIEKPFRTHDVVGRIDAAIDESVQADSSRQRWLPGCEPLTAREGDVLAHLAGGLTNKEVARRMHLSARTIEGYRASILKKAGARNVTDLRPGFARPGLNSAFETRLCCGVVTRSAAMVPPQPRPTETPIEPVPSLPRLTTMAWHVSQRPAGARRYRQGEV
jgi:DNA-binding NarL/FixJ family response regulator